MCGIAGFVGNRVRRGRREILQRMTDSLLHRGPDDEGTYLDDHVALGARRLAVIDRATGRQPIANEDGTVHVVLNGEIYNFADLRARLEHRGHRFRTRSDAEVIVHAYEETGEDCVRDLDGMFAFALWDVSRRRLLLARDRMGEKPLYYYAGPDILVFGSELRALLACTDLPRGLNLESLSRYLLFECVPSPHSILTGIAKLPPGHTLLVSPGDKVRLTRYWEMRFAPDHSVDDIEWLGRLRTQLDASVKSRLVSDVPLGSNDRLAGHRPGSRKASGAPVRPRRTRDRLRSLFRPSGSRNTRLSDVCLRPATFLRRHERWRGCQARDRCERWQRDSWGGATSSCSSGNRRRPNEVSVISAEYGATTHSSMEMAMRSGDARCPRGGSR